MDLSDAGIQSAMHAVTMLEYDALAGANAVD